MELIDRELLEVDLIDRELLQVDSDNILHEVEAMIQKKRYPETTTKFKHQLAQPAMHLRRYGAEMHF